MQFKYNLTFIHAQLAGEDYDTYKRVRAKYEDGYVNLPHGDGKSNKPRLRSPRAFRGLWSKILKELHAKYGYKPPTQRASRARQRREELKARIRELTLKLNEDPQD